MSDVGTVYGFTFGPATVQRICHIEGRGRVLEIRTPYDRIQVHITEAGRKINVHRLGPYADPCSREAEARDQQERQAM